MIDQNNPDIDQVFSLFREFPRWINIHGEPGGQWSCRAKEVDRSFNALPTLTVELSAPQGLIAAYKCNITLVGAGRRSWLLFSPLVVVWAQSRQERGPGFGRGIIEHGVSAIEGYCRAHAPHITDILVASGNLTTVKGGKPFFQGLGWEIVDAQTCEHYAEDDLAGMLAHIAAQIDAALAPLRLAAPETIEPISFAVLRLSRPSIIPQAARSAGASATIPAR